MRDFLGSISIALAASAGLSACGQTADDAPSGGASGPSAAPPNSDRCVATTAGTELASPVVELPATLEGELCTASDALWVSFDGNVEDFLREPIHARLARASGGPYTVTLFGVDGGALQPLPNDHDTHVFALEEGAPELYFANGNTFTDDRVVLKLEGPPGEVALDLDRPLLPPYTNCSGTYDGLPVTTPASPLPVVLDAELCNYRDSRAWAIDVVAGRPVTVTLENPLSIERFELLVARADVDGYEPLPVASGFSRKTLGLVAARTAEFTPLASGPVALAASLGACRGEAPRLRVEQE